MHFGLYDLNEINQLLDQAENNADKTVSLADITPIAAWQWGHVYGKKAAIDSVQGLSIDNDRNIYIASECPPINVVKTKKVKVNVREDKSKDKKPQLKTVKIISFKSAPKKLIRVPWGVKDPKQWTYARVTNPTWKKWATEFEGMQLQDSDLLLTVSYHDPKVRTTKHNLIFKIAGFVL